MCYVRKSQKLQVNLNKPVHNLWNIDLKLLSETEFELTHDLNLNQAREPSHANLMSDSRSLEKFPNKLNLVPVWQISGMSSFWLMTLSMIFFFSGGSFGLNKKYSFLLRLAWENTTNVNGRMYITTVSFIIIMYS